MKSEQVVINRLRRRITEAGSLRQCAKQLKLSPAYLSDVMNGHRRPGPSILKPLGFSVQVQRVYREQA